MSAARGETAERVYVRAVVDLWAEFTGRPVVLSQREWEMVRDWHARGVPLGVLREALLELSLPAPRARRRPARRLSYLAPLVEEACQALREGRTLRPDPGLARPDSEP